MKPRVTVLDKSNPDTIISILKKSIQSEEKKLTKLLKNKSDEEPIQLTQYNIYLLNKLLEEMTN